MADWTLERTEYKLDARKRKLYLDAIREGYGRHAAAKKVGVSPQAVHEYRKRHPEFIAEICDAECIGDDELAELAGKSLRYLLINNDRTATIFVLQNLRSEKWQDRRNSPVIVQQVSLEELEKEIKRLSKNDS